MLLKDVVTNNVSRFGPTNVSPDIIDVGTSIVRRIEPFLLHFCENRKTFKPNIQHDEMIDDS